MEVSGRSAVMLTNLCSLLPALASRAWSPCLSALQTETSAEGGISVTALDALLPVLLEHRLSSTRTLGTGDFSASIFPNLPSCLHRTPASL